jgi:hypothetical protein
MWFRIDDDFLNHPKVNAAARALGGPQMLGRVAAVWLEAGLYASKYVTDGFVPQMAVAGFRTDKRAEDVMLAGVTAGLFRKADVNGEPGYQFHDWDQYNPTASDVKAKRARDRARKAGASAPGTSRPNGQYHASVVPDDSMWNPDGIVVESAACPSGIQTDAIRIPPGVDADSRALARARSRPLPQDQDPRDQDPRGGGRAVPARMQLLALQDVRRHLLRAAHCLIESGDPQFVDARTGAVLVGSLTEELKHIAAAYLRAEWQHGLELTRIVEAVLAIRAQRLPQRALLASGGWR